jgi:hypothetical protein
VKAASQGEKNWLIIKTGAAMPPARKFQDDSSALTNRSMDQIAKANKATWQSNRPPTAASTRKNKTPR